MKRPLLTLFAVMACALVYATPIQIGNFYYELNGTTATLVQHESYKQLTQAFIPASVTYNTHEYSVTAVDDNSFYGCTELLAVSVPSSVTYVGTRAFGSCTWLDSVAWHPVRLTGPTFATNTFPFYNCAKIRKFTFGATVERIPGYLCYQQSGITELDFPAGLKSIGSNAFAGTGVTSVVLPEGFNETGSGVFSGCSNLVSVHIPSSLSSIGDYFCSSTALSEITLPETVTTIGIYAFWGTQLSSVTVPESVGTVGENAFGACANLKTVLWKPVRLSAGFASNTSPFYGTPLETITFGANVQRIPGYLFYEQTGVTSLEFPAGLQFIANYAFSRMTGITAIELPEGFSSMGNGIFSNCSNLMSINIPSSLSSIGNYFCSGTALNEIAIPSSVTSIGSEAFWGTNITTVTLHENVSSVGSKAFAASKLTTVVWNAANVSASYATNTYPFYGCPLTSITFGEHVTAIPSYLCYDITTLNEIFNYAATPQTIETNVLRNVNKNTCTLYVPKVALEAYKTKNVWKDFVNMVGTLPTLRYVDTTTTITYLGREDADTLHFAPLKLYMPVAPEIEGYVFVTWEVVAGDFADGIVLQAIYKANESTSNESPSSQNPAATKLIRRGNVYILRDDRMFTITGNEVR